MSDVPPVSPDYLVRLLAIQSQLTIEEGRDLREMLASLEPLDVRDLLLRWRQTSFPQALAKARLEIAKWRIWQNEER